MRDIDPTSAAMAIELNRVIDAMRLRPYMDAEPTSLPQIVSIAFGDIPALIKPHQVNVDALRFACWLRDQLPAPRVVVHALQRKLERQPRAFIPHCY